jgi:hypothetical protein
MTSLADAPEVPSVNVICAVTADTRRRFSDFLLYPRPVTRVAMKTFMFAIEWKVGLRVMVEMPLLPVSGIVALVTERSQTTLVYILIILFMT